VQRKSGSLGTALANERGVSVVEYVVMLTLVAVAAIAAWTTFGAQTSRTTQCAADAISGGALGPCGSGAGGGPGSDDALSATSPRARDATSSPPASGAQASAFASRESGSLLDFASPPGYSDADTHEARRARYHRIKGVPFIKGRRDGRFIHPNDVSQGMLGDCYFLSALASIAQTNPNLIKRMIRRNRDGTYTVTLWDERRKTWQRWETEWVKHEIVVSAEFPVIDGDPAFAHSGDARGGQHELWVMLIEKAWAKMHGGYDHIEGGTGSDALEALTGKPSRTHGGRNYHKWWGLRMGFDELASYVDRGYAMVASSDSGDELVRNGTLVGDHSYYITGVDRARRTVTIRNPWGWEYEPITIPWDRFEQAFYRLVVAPTH